MRGKRQPVPPPRHTYPIDDWRLVQVEIASHLMAQDETLFAVGNGYIGIRGSHDEGRPVAVPGTYINGFHETWPIVYGETAFGFARTGQTMLPVYDASVIQVYVDDEPLYLPTARLSKFERALDMRTGVLERHVVWETLSGKRVEIRSRRLVSLDERHLVAIAYEFTLLDGEAPVAVFSDLGLPPTAQAGEADPRRGRIFPEQVLMPALHRSEGARIVLGHRTRRSGMTIACGVDHAFEYAGALDVHTTELEADRGRVRVTFNAQRGESFRLTKLAAYHSSRGRPPEELATRVGLTLDRARQCGFEAIVAAQHAHLDAFWERSDVEIAAVHPRAQQIMRFNLFQMYQAAARAEGVGVGARGLTGPAYDGHYFWDTEMYVLPFLIYTSPRIARNLLHFRHSMLEHARRRARELNQRGALFPWRTINGEEASAYYAAGTAQYHINADIAYAVRKYVQITGDDSFLEAGGAELLVETARLWLDLGFYSARREHRFCIHGVTGPDEYNTVVDNNTFTNLMARENLWYAASTIEWLRRERPDALVALRHRTDLRDEEPTAWAAAADAMYIPFDEELGIHPQDDGFLERKPWDFDGTPAENYPLLLHYHPLVIYRHQVIKQADIALAMFLLGNEFSREQKRLNFDFYDPLTTGDSSLSASIQAIIAAEVGYLEAARDYFSRAAVVDLADAAGNVADGCHIASMGGTWMAAIYGLAGLRDYGGQISFDPRVANRTRVRFRLTVRGQQLEVAMSTAESVYTLRSGTGLEIRHQGTLLRLEPGVPVAQPNAPLETLDRVQIDAARFDAVLFDLDGVLTRTATLHASCWKETFDAFLSGHATGEAARPFDIATDYGSHVDGKLRNDGVRSFLASRGITLPEGTPADAPELETVAGLGNRKNALFQQRLGNGEVEVFGGSIDFAREIRRRGLKTAVVTASANGPAVLAAAKIADLFDRVVDGKVAEERSLLGKPAPDSFLEAARELNVEPWRAVVVEDAESGVQAGQAGRFGLVIGVDRHGRPERLRACGADIVVSDLADLLAG